jgi:hypothetical protein
MTHHPHIDASPIKGVNLKGVDASICARVQSLVLPLSEGDGCHFCGGPLDDEIVRMELFRIPVGRVTIRCGSKDCCRKAKIRRSAIDRLALSNPEVFGLTKQEAIDRVFWMIEDRQSAKSRRRRPHQVTVI